MASCDGQDRWRAWQGPSRQVSERRAALQDEQELQHSAKSQWANRMVQKEAKIAGLRKGQGGGVSSAHQSGIRLSLLQELSAEAPGDGAIDPLRHDKVADIAQGVPCASSGSSGTGFLLPGHDGST
jgi:hypothetical protein